MTTQVCWSKPEFWRFGTTSSIRPTFLPRLEALRWGMFTWTCRRGPPGKKFRSLGADGGSSDYDCGGCCSTACRQRPEHCQPSIPTLPFDNCGPSHRCKCDGADVWPPRTSLHTDYLIRFVDLRQLRRAHCLLDFFAEHQDE